MGNREKVLGIVEVPAEEINIARKDLSNKLPNHMVPSVWFTVEAIPMMASGKLNRQMVTRWVEHLDESVCRRIIGLSEPDTASQSQIRPATEVESMLRDVWSDVLNIPLDHVHLDRSFLNLGGDSISCLMVKNKAAKQGYGFTAQEILRSKSIIQLAQHAKEVERISHTAEIIEESFDLSPIQKMYFELPNQGHGHFNQSFFLKVTRKISGKDLQDAIETIVQRHSMLRARFQCSGPGDSWQQRITEDVLTSYRFREHRIETPADAIDPIEETQISLDPVNGPLFGADLFEVKQGEQLLFMVGHHLIIDLVSWRVLLGDIEEELLNPQTALVERPLSFQTWSQIQVENTKTFPINDVLPEVFVPENNGEYWGISNRQNIYGEVACEGFSIDSRTTASILTECHECLRTETIDILLSALIYSFSLAFEDRQVPAIYTEGHGREPPSPTVDLSRTVGWFTTMYPVHVLASVSRDALDIVTQVKDLRQRIPGNGRPYFASRCLTEEGREHFGKDWPLEITFNYLGRYQQLERKDTLLKPVESMAGEARGAGGMADVGYETPRFGLFEISAVVVQGELRFSFTFNRHMKHQEEILQWVSACQRSLGFISRELENTKPRPTLSDFPLLSLTYDGLQAMVLDRLPQIGVSSISKVEQIFPCGSMQEGLLISQTKNLAFYAVQVVLRLEINDGAAPDPQRLYAAWQSVVDRHSSLRTIFMESVSNDDGIYDQVVLKHVDVELEWLYYSTEESALQILGKKEPITYQEGKPPHRFTICQISNGTVFCKLAISHAIMDGGSMSIIFRDLALAYEGVPRTDPAPLYSDYIAHIRSQDNNVGIEYWKSYLRNAESCSFPNLNDGITQSKELHTLRLDFPDSQFAELQKFCEGRGVTFSNVLHAAWALTLRSYCDSEDVCFGYLKSERDAPIEGIENAVGPFINTLVCRVRMPTMSDLQEVLDQVQKDYLESLPYQNTSLAEVQHALQLSGAALFNTALSYRRLPSEQDEKQSSVSFIECMPIYDPTEYTVSVNIEASQSHAVIDLDYWTDSISDGQAANIASTFIQSLKNIMYHSDQNIERLDFLSDTGRQQILGWNSNVPNVITECLHTEFEKQVQLQPVAPAICAWDENFSYKQLDNLATRLAQHLITIGVKRADSVPVCFDKSAFAVVAMFAALKAGATMVPLDAKHPESALALRLRDTQANFVLAAPAHLEKFQDLIPHVIPVDQAFLDSLPHVTGNVPQVVDPTDSAVIIYT